MPLPLLENKERFPRWRGESFASLANQCHLFPAMQIGRKAALPKEEKIQDLSGNFPRSTGMECAFQK
jgi:hypothetical protein